MRDGLKSTSLAVSIAISVAATPVAPPQSQAQSGVAPAGTTTVCEILRRPAEFDGRIVTVRARVASGFEIFGIRDTVNDCGLIWLTYAGGGPTASLSFGAATASVQRPEVSLRRDREFAQYERALEARMYGRERGAGCFGCNRYEVTATMTGRVDVAPAGSGFGHLNSFPAQFVLEQVARVATRDLASEYDPKLWSTTPIRFPTGYVVGKVMGPDGRPIPGIYVRVRRMGERNYIDDSMATDEKGAFKIGVPPGTYTVAANVVFPPSAKWPYPRTWAPGTVDETAARQYSVADGRRVDATLRAPVRLSERRLRVRVMWPDGTPVPQANAWLAEQSDPRSVVGIAVSHTDADGRVELSGLSGVRYLLRANIYLTPYFRPHCAESLHVGVLDPLASEIEMVLTREGETCRSLDE